MNKTIFKRFLMIAIVIVLIFSIYSVAFAEMTEFEAEADSTEVIEPENIENNVAEVENSEEVLVAGGLERERVEQPPLQTIVVDPSIPEDAEPMQEGAYEEISLEDAALQNKEVLPRQKFSRTSSKFSNADSSDINIVNGLTLQKAKNAVKSSDEPAASAAALIDDEFTGANANPNTMEIYGYFVLYPNEIMQIGMENPVNSASPMDYDLYLCEYDIATENMTIIDQSLYKSNFINDKTLDEGLNVTNKTSGTKAYVLAVHSKTGSGAEHLYKIYYSVDSISNINFNENDQNVASYCATVTPGQYISGLGMNSKSDVDWFALYVEVPAAYYSYGLNITAGNNDVEVYEHLGNMEFKQKTPYSGNKVEFNEGDHGKTFFIRVFSQNRANHAFNVYTLSAASVDHLTKPRSIEITGYSCEEQPSNNYVLWPEGNHYSYSGSWLNINGVLKDAFGNGVGDNFDIVSTYKSEAWYDKTDGREGEYESTTATNSDGTFTINYSGLKPPIWDRQVYNPVSNLIHYYSLCEVGVGWDNKDYTDTIAMDTIYMWSHAHQPF